jgi:hypothetical protein
VVKIPDITFQDLIRLGSSRSPARLHMGFGNDPLTSIAQLQQAATLQSGAQGTALDMAAGLGHLQRGNGDLMGAGDGLMQMQMLQQAIAGAGAGFPVMLGMAGGPDKRGGAPGGMLGMPGMGGEPGGRPDADPMMRRMGYPGEPGGFGMAGGGQCAAWAAACCCEYPCYRLSVLVRVLQHGLLLPTRACLRCECCAAKVMPEQQCGEAAL